MKQSTSPNFCHPIYPSTLAKQIVNEGVNKFCSVCTTKLFIFSPKHLSKRKKLEARLVLQEYQNSYNFVNSNKQNLGYKNYQVTYSKQRKNHITLQFGPLIH